MTNEVKPNVFTVATPFGGCGGGAYGAQQAQAKFRGLTGAVRVVGGYDYEQYACDAFEYLTGVPQVCADARKLTPEDIRRIWGPVAPWSIISSPPCIGATALISHAKAETDYYREMNGLMLPSTKAILDAYGPDPMNMPAFFIFENVPGLGSAKRGGGMLDALYALFGSYKCFAIHRGHHNARHVGGGAQNRVRLLIVVRNTVRVPVFLYKCPHKAGLVVGDVIGPLPLPDDPRGGPMHKTTKRMSFLNRLRLWAIEAGGDWRSLRGRRDALAMKVPEGAHANMYRVADEGEASPVVTCAIRPGGGGLSIADSRVPVDLDTGVRFTGAMGVLRPDGPADTVLAESAPSNGRFAVAQPIDLTPQASNENLHTNKYIVVPWLGTAHAVTTATRIGSGAQGVAQPVDLTTEAFRGSYGVLSTLDPSGSIKANAFPTTGPYSVAAPVPVELVPDRDCFPSAYGVLAQTQPSRTVKSTSNSVGNGAYAVADDVARQPIELALTCAPRAGAYGVNPYTEASPTVLAQGSVDNSTVAVADPRVPRYVILTYAQVEKIVAGEVPIPFAIVDPEHPETPLAIVDDLKKPAWRPLFVTNAKGIPVMKRDPVTVVLISADGTWHRELTTLELARLQDFPAMHKGAPLDFGGSTTAQRRVVGNAIPCAVMRSVFSQIIISSLASAEGFFLVPSDWDVWVQGLRDEGYEVIAAGSGPVDIGGGVMLDDGAMVPAPTKPKPTKRKAEAKPGKPPVQVKHRHDNHPRQQ